jgi:NADPH-dependent 2,4-dienoyl-CoA reductase/sulfur reductase-like enzyme
MMWQVEFYHERRGLLRRYGIDAVSLATAVESAWKAVFAEHPPAPRRRVVSLFRRAQVTGGQDQSGWVLHRIARTDGPGAP